MHDDILVIVITLETYPDEWERMWTILAQQPLNDGDRICEDRLTGERWQYMGTQRTEDGWMHYFRHRYHPRTGRREYCLIPANLTTGLL